MDQQILFNKSKINEDVLEELIGLPADIILERLGEPQSKSSEEWIYHQNKNGFWEMFRPKIYLFFHRGTLREYYLGI
jgi:hypothetical protein